jgi:hypothetical protein
LRLGSDKRINITYSARRNCFGVFSFVAIVIVSSPLFLVFGLGKLVTYYYLGAYFFSLLKRPDLRLT